MAECNFCGSIDHEDFILVKDRFSDEYFQYVNCAKCSLIFLKNPLSETEILNYYPKDYEAYNPKADQKVLEKKLKFMFSFCEIYSSILDIGCSNGGFLTVAKEMGIESIYGVELNSSMAMEASQRGIEVLGYTLEDAYQTGKTFDVITLWDVLEHLPDPNSALEKIHEMLSQNGFLFISIPNTNSFDRYLFGKNWIGWDAPRHYFLFSVELIKSLLYKKGFGNIVIHGITGAKGAFNLSLDKIFGREVSNSRFYQFISLLLWPYRKLGYVLNMCPVITVVARKKN